MADADVGIKLTCGAIVIGALGVGILTGYLAGKAWGKQYQRRDGYAA